MSTCCIDGYLLGVLNVNNIVVDTTTANYAVTNTKHGLVEFASFGRLPTYGRGTPIIDPRAGMAYQP